MIVRTLKGLETLGRIKFPADGSFRSARYLTAEDGMGFSYNENRVRAGFDLQVWLKNHWEANYIVSGRGEVTYLTTGEVLPLQAGVLYVVGPNDRHRLRFTEDECHVSIFHPPLTGNERFDDDGSYEASGPVPQTDRRMFARSLEGLAGTGDQVHSVEMLSDADDVGFRLSHVSIRAGHEELPLPSDRALANHVISGVGLLTELETGRSWPLAPGTAICIAAGEPYAVQAEEDLVFLSIAASEKPFQIKG